MTLARSAPRTVAYTNLGMQVGSGDRQKRCEDPTYLHNLSVGTILTRDDWPDYSTSDRMHHSDMQASSRGLDCSERDGRWPHEPMTLI